VLSSVVGWFYKSLHDFIAAYIHHGASPVNRIDLMVDPGRHVTQAIIRLVSSLAGVLEADH